ncbi:MAG: fibronectin type III domain-containing protein [Chloroflexi bacterium]|nr:fibronectin type III domain-containing protein [Chloroflexota bacterium]
MMAFPSALCSARVRGAAKRFAAFGLLLLGLFVPLAMTQGTSQPDLSAPTGFTGTLKSDGIEFSWTAPAVESSPDYEVELVGYMIQRYVQLPSGALGWSEVYESSSDTSTNQTVTPALSEDSDYNFRVMGIFRINDSYNQRGPASDTVTVSIPAAPTAANLSATIGDDGTDVEWTAPSLSWRSDLPSLTSIVVERLETDADGVAVAGASWTELSTLGTGATSYSDTSGSSGSYYVYGVRAVYDFVRGDRVETSTPVAVPVAIASD